MRTRPVGPLLFLVLPALVALLGWATAVSASAADAPGEPAIDFGEPAPQWLRESESYAIGYDPAGFDACTAAEQPIRVLIVDGFSNHDWARTYDRIIGLGWRGKDAGTAITIGPNGQLQRIPPGEGAGTSHGPRTDRVIHRLGDHPIHAGLPRNWTAPTIEVYTYARGPAEELTVLSCSEDPATKVRWPVEWTVNYGKGRVYNSVFGHVWRGEADPPGMRCAGFQTILVRALQWLANRPTDFPIPPDFPSGAQPVLRPMPDVG